MINAVPFCWYEKRILLNHFAKRNGIPFKVLNALPFWLGVSRDLQDNKFGCFSVVCPIFFDIEIEKQWTFCYFDRNEMRLETFKRLTLLGIQPASSCE